MIKVIPDDNFQEIDINALMSGGDVILSTSLKISQIQLTGADKNLLNNLDEWVFKPTDEKSFIT